MRISESWLVAIWRRETEYWSKKMLRQLQGELLFLAASFVIFGISTNPAYKIYNKLAQVPEALRTAWGIYRFDEYRPGVLILVWVLLPLGIFVLWSAVNRMVKIIWREEEDNSIYILCNQWYGRTQIGIAKVTWGILSCILEYSMLMLVDLLLIAMAGRGYNNAYAIRGIVISWISGSVVIVMVVSIAACIGMACARKKKIICGDVLIAVPWIVGNLYKIRELGQVLIKQRGLNLTTLVEVLRGTEWLQVLSPYRYMNPFRRFESLEWTISMLIFLTIAIVANLIGLKKYKTRRFI